MCGIFGLIQAQPFEAAELNGMSRLLRHRGPDDEGFALFGPQGLRLFGGVDTPTSSFDASVAHCPQQSLPATGPLGTTGGVALGHRRLSIIDLSSHGHQPMPARGRYWISYNGEVYNYLELRTELQALGYRFDSGSDTEVILAAYDRWGADCLARFNGMWGLAILDTLGKTLFLARDRFGVKPLYLWAHAGGLAFASEIKAFSALGGWRARADRERLLDFLVWNISDHTERTMFEGVQQLPAGHFVLLDVAAVLDGKDQAVPKFEPRRWYQLPAAGTSPDAATARRVFGELMDDAVRLRLRADVTVGSCLSGGLDSSTIVCLMGRQLKAQSAGDALHTFTARSHDAEFDEFAYASTVIEAARSTPHTVVPEPGRLFDDLAQLAWHQDEPFVSTSIFAQWCVFKLAREAGVIVMLDGQGADEILGGYRGFFGAYLAGLLRSGRVGQWLSELGAMKREVGFSPLRSAGYTAAYLAPSLVALAGRFDGRAYAERDWLDPACSAGYTADPVHAAGGRPSSVREMSVAQVSATNLPMLLRWEDRNSMAFSVEARVPFLDYRVVEYCLGMADEEKVGKGISKRVLRDSMRGTVPDRILDRRDKMGFVTAERLWVTRDMAPRFRRALADARDALPGVLAPRIVEQFDEVVAGRRAFDYRYWRAISAGQWARSFDVSV